MKNSHWIIAGLAGLWLLKKSGQSPDELIKFIIQTTGITDNLTGVDPAFLQQWVNALKSGQQNFSFPVQIQFDTQTGTISNATENK